MVQIFQREGKKDPRFGYSPGKKSICLLKNKVWNTLVEVLEAQIGKGKGNSNMCKVFGSTLVAKIKITISFVSGQDSNGFKPMIARW